MTRRRYWIDWYCCEGGASAGYLRALEAAGVIVVGGDLFKHRDPRTGKMVGFTRARYPFPSWQGDALVGLRALLDGEALTFSHAGTGEEHVVGLEDVVGESASPPCQHASAGTRAMRAAGDDRHPALIEPTRDLLRAHGVPYVIENVSGAALLDPVTLCWSMFDSPETPWVRNEDGVRLRMERHRLFEASFPLEAPRPCWHPDYVQVAGSYGAAQRTIAGAKRRRGGYVPSAPVQAALLGIDWMTERGMHQSVPPAYTEHIGRAFLAHIEQEAAA